MYGKGSTCTFIDYNEQYIPGIFHELTNNIVLVIIVISTCIKEHILSIGHTVQKTTIVGSMI